MATEVKQIRDVALISPEDYRKDGYSLCLGLDLGTDCGYAYSYVRPGAKDPLAGPIVCGQLDLSLATYDSGAARPARLRHFIRTLEPVIIFMEDVRYTPAMPPGMRAFSAAAILARSATAMEMFGVLKHTVQDCGEERGIPVIGIPIQTIKRFATNMGNANKVAMIAAANTQFGLKLDAKSYESTGVDNVADALFALACGLRDYRLAIPGMVDPMRKRRRFIGHKEEGKAKANRGSKRTAARKDRRK